jgi:thymus-specific serine protease
LGHFVQFIKTQYYYTANSNVILFGKGIGAAVAVWAKQKYPHLINGVWASSAPLYTSLNFREYMENVGYTLRSIGGQRCYDRIEEAFRRLEQVVARGERLGDIRNEFRLCSEINHNDPLEVASFFQGLAMVFGTFVESAAYPDIESACVSMVNSQRQGDVEAVAQWMMREYLENIPCLEIGHSDQLRIFSDERWDTTATTQGRRQEFYRRCTQLSNYPTSDSNDQPFGNSFNTNEFTQSCELLFGEEFNAYYAIQGARRMNTFFGGRNPDIRNVFFTNGELDPRRTLGVLEDLNEWSPAMVIPRELDALDY